MMKMGWKPGQTLGKKNNGLQKPINIKGQLNRHGVGYEDIEKDLVKLLKIKSEFPRTELYVQTVFETNDDVDYQKELIGSMRSEIDITLYNEQFIALLDTGSDVSCISESLFLQLKTSNQNLSILPVKALQIRGAIGQRSTKIQQMIILPIKIGEIVFETQMLIVNNLIRSIILGFDWMKLNKIIIDLKHTKVGIAFRINVKDYFIPFRNISKSYLCSSNIENYRKYRKGGYFRKY